MTILAALLLGVATTAVYARPARRALPTLFSCLVLTEAEKAGYLDKAKRAVLIDALAKTNSLNSAERDAVTALQTVDKCKPMLAR